MSQNFLKPYEQSDGNEKVELDLSNNATMVDLKEATGIDTSALASKIDLDGLKTKLDNEDEQKLKIIFADLSKLSNAVDK